MAAWMTLAGGIDAHPPGGVRASQVETLKVHTDLVVLHVAVLDGKSRFVPGLPQDRFNVYEDGVPQTIRVFTNEEGAATIGLVIDNSGSMHNKRTDVGAAALAFARASNPLDEFFVVHFNERVWMGLPEGAPFTSVPVMLTESLSHIGAYGRTALYDAVERGLQHLSDAHNPHRVLVVVSDGGDNASAMSFERLLRHAQQTDTVIYTIGLFDEYSRDRNPRILKELAAATGGEAFLPGSVRGATAVLERIAHDIRSTYLVGYEPTNAIRDERYRKVRVVVDAADRGTLKVRARTGYFASAPTGP
jgi:VWFA-related protein